MLALAVLLHVSHPLAVIGALLVVWNEIQLVDLFQCRAAGHISLNVREKFNLGDRPVVAGTTAWPKETVDLSQEEKTKNHLVNGA